MEDKLMGDGLQPPSIYDMSLDQAGSGRTSENFAMVSSPKPQSKLSAAMVVLAMIACLLLGMGTVMVRGAACMCLVCESNYSRIVITIVL
jgi:hypothetical protein